MSSGFAIFPICGLILTLAFVIPSLVVASKDKDKDCPKPLWTWILVCNITFAVANLLTFIAGCDNEVYNSIACVANPIFGLFFLSWSIVGLVWATRSGVKESCGKLYNVALGDAITLLCLPFLMVLALLILLSNMTFAQ